MKQNKISAIIIFVLVSLSFGVESESRSSLKCADIECLNKILDTNLNVVVFYRNIVKKPSKQMKIVKYLIEDTDLLTELNIPLVTVYCG
jgi:hypothetical protein